MQQVDTANRSRKLGRWKKKPAGRRASDGYAVGLAPTLAANQSTAMEVDEQVATFEPAVSGTETSPNKTSAVMQVDEQEVTVKPAALDTEPSSNTASAAKQVDEALSAVQAYLGSPLNTSDKVVRAWRGWSFAPL
jgi:hypothetical protein